MTAGWEISRRKFVRSASAALALAGVARPLTLLGDTSATPVIQGKEGMIIRSSRFVDLEMPAEYASSWITPIEHFFVRNHMHEPISWDVSDWKLTVGGEVQTPLSLTLDDLAKFPSHEVVNTLECAGNGRGLQRPVVPGVQWTRGAVGTARFSGVRLADVLAKAGLKDSGHHVMFRGADEVPGKVPPFIRSIPMEKAIDGDTLIATHMNAQPLPHDNGFPARVMTPGWVGAASCKWLTEIKVLRKEFEGNFMKPGYRLPNHPVKPGEAVNPDDTHPVTSLQVKSLIALSDDAQLHGKNVKLQGAAWAGGPAIERVELSFDSGQNWHAAKLGHEQEKYAWRMWSYKWKAPKSGEYTVLSRATDSNGNVQPESPVWNPSGYLGNAYDRVRVHVAA